jgi:hypothetical protein
MSQCITFSVTYARGHSHVPSSNVVIKDFFFVKGPYFETREKDRCGDLATSMNLCIFVLQVAVEAAATRVLLLPQPQQQTT